MYLYHSFPRRLRSSPPNVQSDTALKIIRASFKIGILLLPETIEFPPEVLADGSIRQPILARQRRFCMTCLTPSELREHSQHFGLFAFEFEISTMRALGALPVIYIPDPQAHARINFSSFGHFLVCRLQEVQRALNQLAELEAISRSAGIAGGKMAATHELAVQAMHYMDEDRVEFEQLAQATKTMSNLFYHTEREAAESNDEHNALEYYLQREWRLVADLILDNGQGTTRKLELSEKVQVSDIDRLFFQRPFKFDTRVSCIIDETLALKIPVDLCLADIIRRVIVPGSAGCDVRLLCRDCGFPEDRVCALEDL